MKSKLIYAYWTVRAFANNAYVEIRNTLLENSKRRWKAYKVGGGGVVPLGKVSQKDAIAIASKIGTVDFVDTEVAVIFYSDKFK
jgi:hypothetical protein